MLRPSLRVELSSDDRFTWSNNCTPHGLFSDLIGDFSVLIGLRFNRFLSEAQFTCSSNCTPFQCLRVVFPVCVCRVPRVCVSCSPCVRFVCVDLEMLAFSFQKIGLL